MQAELEAPRSDMANMDRSLRQSTSHVSDLFPVSTRSIHGHTDCPHAGCHQVSVDHHGGKLNVTVLALSGLKKQFRGALFFYVSLSEGDACLGQLSSQYGALGAIGTRENDWSLGVPFHVDVLKELARFRWGVENWSGVGCGKGRHHADSRDDSHQWNQGRRSLTD